METRETKCNPAELNDDALENVSGGAILETPSAEPCANCGRIVDFSQLIKIDGKWYCERCEANAR